MYGLLTLAGGVLLVCTTTYDFATSRGYISSRSEQVEDRPDQLPRVGASRDQNTTNSESDAEMEYEALSSRLTASEAHERIVLSGYVLGALLLLPGALEYGGLI